MDLGADIEIKDSDGLTALLHAAHKGHKAVVRVLANDDSKGRTALMLAASSGNEAAVWWLQMITIIGYTAYVLLHVTPLPDYVGLRLGYLIAP